MPSRSTLGHWWLQSQDKDGFPGTAREAYFRWRPDCPHGQVLAKVEGCEQALPRAGTARLCNQSEHVHSIVPGVPNPVGFGVALSTTQAWCCTGSPGRSSGRRQTCVYLTVPCFPKRAGGSATLPGLFHTRLGSNWPRIAWFRLRSRIGRQNEPGGWARHGSPSDGSGDG